MNQTKDDAQTKCVKLKAQESDSDEQRALHAREVVEVDPKLATCHCGAIRIRVQRLPRTLTSCNCSICRRYGVLWAYYQASSVQIEAPKGNLASYSWNRRTREYRRCAVCGCVTHYTYRRKRTRATIAINANNFDLSVVCTQYSAALISLGFSARPDPFILEG